MKSYISDLSKDTKLILNKSYVLSTVSNHPKVSWYKQLFRNLQKIKFSAISQ